MTALLRAMALADEAADAMHEAGVADAHGDVRAALGHRLRAARCAFGAAGWGLCAALGRLVRGMP